MAGPSYVRMRGTLPPGPLPSETPFFKSPGTVGKEFAPEYSLWTRNTRNCIATGDLLNPDGRVAGIVRRCRKDADALRGLR